MIKDFLVLLNLDKVNNNFTLVQASVQLWMSIRDTRIVHDYLPTQIKSMYDCIMGEFFVELQYAKGKIDQIIVTKT